MKAATNINYGDGENNHEFVMGQELPDDVAEDLPDNLILEKLAEGNPEGLTRPQLMVLAGLDGVEVTEPLVHNEDDLREALGNLRTKTDVLDWFNTVHPGQTLISHTDDQTREDMVDAIVEELTGE